MAFRRKCVPCTALNVVSHRDRAWLGSVRSPCGTVIVVHRLSCLCTCYTPVCLVLLRSSELLRDCLGPSWSFLELYRDSFGPSYSFSYCRLVVATICARCNLNRLSGWAQRRSSSAGNELEDRELCQLLHMCMVDGLDFRLQDEVNGNYRMLPFFM